MILIFKIESAKHRLLVALKKKQNQKCLGLFSFFFLQESKSPVLLFSEV